MEYLHFPGLSKYPIHHYHNNPKEIVLIFHLDFRLTFLLDDQRLLTLLCLQVFLTRYDKYPNIYINYY